MAFETDLANRKCVPCSGGTPRLAGEALERFEAQVPGWSVVDEHQLERSFTFPDFKAALAFANKVGEIAESENHHPDILVSWGKTVVTVWTHKIDGLSEADFVLAAKVSRI
jgi:4a-hydroxytetrahydrobiopterin dehydratase